MWKCQLDLGAVHARDGAAVELRQQVFFRARDDVHQLAVERFFIAEGSCVGDCRFREIAIAAALDRVAAQVGCGVVHDFLAEGFVDLYRRAADFDQRRGCASFCSWRHRGDVTGKQDEKSC